MVHIFQKAHLYQFDWKDWGKSYTDQYASGYSCFDSVAEFRYKAYKAGSKEDLKRTTVFIENFT